ncbi:MAG: hypothetical protein IJT91_00395 [Clostridia bacterium]|nr:hypothetical protein [Clostridia bacterium]
MNEKTINTAKKKIKARSTIQRVFGIIIVAFFALVLIGSFIPNDTGATDAVTGIVIAVPFIAVGAWLIYLSVKNTKFLKSFDEYRSRFGKDPEIILDDMASSVGKTPIVLKKELDKMITLNLFPGCYIDTQENRMIFPEKSSSGASGVFAPQGAERTVKCPGCGATNTITGEVGTCKYCGTAIS